MQIQQAIGKANGRLSFIARGIEYKSKAMLHQLHETPLRPQLKYYVSVWPLYVRRDILTIKGVIQTFTRCFFEEGV